MKCRAPSLLILILTIAPFAAAEEDLPLEVRVNRAIDRAAANLVSRQAEDGSWQKEDKVHPLGRTALCAFALLHAGYPKDHPAIRKAVAFLGVEAGYGSTVEPSSIYEAGCLVLFLNALGPAAGPTIHRISDWIVGHFDMGRGLWAYPDGIHDLSNTQYAVLALKAAERHGYETPEKIWKKLLDSLPRMQSESGAFRYRPGTAYRATMTHAALLIMKFAGEALGMRRLPRDARESMERGHAWAEENYSVTRTPYGRGWHKGNYYYYMYGLERYAVFFEKEEIAGHDWYREGAEVLLERQNKNGSWGNLEETCFAILFLRRATFSEPEVRPGDAGAAEEPEEKKAEPGPPRPARDVPFLREWLVAGPFRGEAGEDDLLYEDHVNPKRGTPVAGAAAGREKWEAFRSGEDKVEFKNGLVGAPWAAYYAATWLHADEDTEAVLWLSSDDGIRAWVDGEDVLFGHHHGHPGRDFYRVPLRLAKGRTLVLLKVENLEYDCYFFARLTDPGGKTLPGVRSALAPR